MSASTPGPVFRVRFDTPTYDQDLQRVRKEGRTVATNARAQLERDGIAVALLSACQSDARDGTELGGLAKLYLPIPYGPWGLVLAGDRDINGPFLAVVAFGERHPHRGPSVYAIAHYRRHGHWPTTPDDPRRRGRRP